MLPNCRDGEEAADRGAVKDLKAKRSGVSTLREKRGLEQIYYDCVRATALFGN